MYVYDNRVKFCLVTWGVSKLIITIKAYNFYCYPVRYQNKLLEPSHRLSLNQGFRQAVTVTDIECKLK